MYRNTGAPHDDSNLRAEWDRPDVGESESVPDTESPPSATTDNADVEAGQLAIVRHGESTANKMGEFSGWGNHGLTDQGEQDAHEAAKHLVAKGMRFDEVHTSVLSRTLRTANIICEYIGYSFHLHTTWRLNERHYGALQECSWKDIIGQYGQQQYDEWYYSFDSTPPLLDVDDDRHPRFDDKYRHIEVRDLPCGESLRDTVRRVLPYWQHTLRPALLRGRNVLVVGHQKSLGALTQLVGMPTPYVADNNASWKLQNGIPAIYQARSDSIRGGAQASGATCAITYHLTPGEGN